MTSAITREDVESVLWQSGIRSHDTIKRLLRTIDLYAFTIARQYVPAPDQPNDPYYYLGPGDSDKGIKVTRCLRCTEVKNWNLFPADSRRETGHGITCKICRKPAGRPVSGKMKCRTCGEEKDTEGNFERRPDSRTGWKLTCIACEAKMKCPVCGRRQRKGTFDPSSPACILCVAQAVEKNVVPEGET